MGAFATIEDYEASYGKATDTALVQARLNNSAAYLRILMKNSGVEVRPDDEDQATLLVDFNCRMVFRSLNEHVGLSQWSETAGVFTWSGSPSNPDGDYYLKTAEMQALGIASTGKHQKMAFVRPAIHDRTGELISGW